MAASNIEYSEGFFAPEDDRMLPFRWMSKRASVIL
jgi:hypothetical protein